MKLYILLPVLALLLAGIAAVLLILRRKRQRDGQSPEAEDGVVLCIPELTMAYLKDWIRIELDEREGCTVGIIALDLLDAKESQASLVQATPPQLKTERGKALVLVVREETTVIRMVWIQYEQLEQALEQALKQNNGTLNVRR